MLALLLVKLKLKRKRVINYEDFRTLQHYDIILDENVNRVDLFFTEAQTGKPVQLGLDFILTGSDMAYVMEALAKGIRKYELDIL
jgi:hypothetical protein